MDHKRALISNFLSLSSVRFTNCLLPLVTLPYLMRVLGPEKVGVIAFAQAFSQFLIILTNYGFTLSAPRQISICRDDADKVAEIFWSVSAVRFILMILCLALLGILVLSVSRFREEWPVFAFSFGLVVGSVVLPVWFFQGMERMTPVAVLNLAARLAFTVCVFLFVRSTDDYPYVPLINAAAQILCGLLSLWIVVVRFKVAVRRPRSRHVVRQFVEGWPFFTSTFATSLYTTCNSFLLGLVANSTVVGYYSAGEKVVNAVRMLLSPLSQTVYPYVSRVAVRSKTRASAFLKKLLRITVLPALLVSLSLLISAPLLSRVLLGEQFVGSVVVIRIMSFVPLLVVLSNVFGVQGLMAFGRPRVFMRLIVPVAAFHLASALLLGFYWEHAGMASALLVTEAVVAAMTFYLFSRCIADRDDNSAGGTRQPDTCDGGMILSPSWGRTADRPSVEGGRVA